MLIIHIILDIVKIKVNVKVKNVTHLSVKNLRDSGELVKIINSILNKNNRIK